MKLAFLTTRGGGVEPYVRTVSQWLLAQGHTCHIVYLGKQPDPPAMNHERLHLHEVKSGDFHYYAYRLGVRSRQLISRLQTYENSRAIARKLIEIRAEHGFDIAEIIEGVAVPALFREVPFILKMHGAEWTFRQYCEDKPWFKHQVTAQRHMLFAARQVHALSRSLADFISGACTFPRRSIHVSPYPIDTRQFCLADPPSSDTPFHLMSVGRLEKRKGTHTLIKALPKIWAVEPEVHLHLFGSNGDFGQAQIETVIPPAQHCGRIHFEGFVPRETLIKRYQQTHVYVAPTRYETFGYTILEAMACGRPVIGSDIGPVPELVHHEETGWLVARDDFDELAEAVLTALRNSDMREAYGRAGRRCAERFDIERLMPEYLRRYQQAAAS